MPSTLNKRVKEIGALCLLALALLLVLSLATYDSSDPTLLTTSPGRGAVRNAMGIVGANLAAVLLVTVGASAYWLPIFLAVAAAWLLQPRPGARPVLLALGGALLLFATSGLAALHWPSLRLWSEPLPASGGMVGLLLKSSLEYYLKPLGASLLLWLCFAVALLLATPISLARFALSLTASLRWLLQRLRTFR
ncbi:MAG: DNA translocase FtsK 4TM domain-containing protein, partial [Syntrophobacteria bacterium]